MDYIKYSKNQQKTIGKRNGKNDNFRRLIKKMVAGTHVPSDLIEELRYIIQTTCPMYDPTTANIINIILHLHDFMHTNPNSKMKVLFRYLRTAFSKCKNTGEINEMILKLLKEQRRVMDKYQKKCFFGNKFDFAIFLLGVKLYWVDNDSRFNDNVGNK